MEQQGYQDGITLITGNRFGVPCSSRLPTSSDGREWRIEYARCWISFERTSLDDGNENRFRRSLDPYKPSLEFKNLDYKAASRLTVLYIIYTNDNYKQWVREPISSTLWCAGILGSGKTVRIPYTGGIDFFRFRGFTA